MLTYEEDNKWDNWDGGYWGRDIESEKNTNSCFKLCKIGCFLCCLLTLVTLPLLYIVTNGKFICILPFIPKQEFCLDHVGANSTENKYINNISQHNDTNLTSNYYINNISNYNDTNITSNYYNYSNSSLYPSGDLPENSIDSISVNNGSLYPFNPVINVSNISSSLLYQKSIKNDIQEVPKTSTDTGEAIAISIACVAGFIIFIASSVYMVRNGGKNIKNYCTNKTASRHNDIKLTEEELKFYEVKNPIQEALERNEGGLFQKGVKMIKTAIQKDRSRDFEEAIKLYNNGIDILLASIKSQSNASDRFAIAKKIDIYVQRVNYISNCLANEKLVGDIKHNNKTK